MHNEYSHAYKEIKHYIFNTSGLLSLKPLIALVDILEEAAAHDKRVPEVTGHDVAGFADELVRGEKSYYDKQREKLNRSVADAARTDIPQ